jgi:hypothetical protein
MRGPGAHLRLVAIPQKWETETGFEQLRLWALEQALIQTRRRLPVSGNLVAVDLDLLVKLGSRQTGERAECRDP